MRQSPISTTRARLGMSRIANRLLAFPGKPGDLSRLCVRVGEVSFAFLCELHCLPLAHIPDEFKAFHAQLHQLDRAQPLRIYYQQRIGVYVAVGAYTAIQTDRIAFQIPRCSGVIALCDPRRGAEDARAGARPAHPHAPSALPHGHDEAAPAQLHPHRAAANRARSR